MVATLTSKRATLAAVWDEKYMERMVIEAVSMYGTKTGRPISSARRRGASKVSNAS